jgi:hypothetical protein
MVWWIWYGDEGIVEFCSMVSMYGEYGKHSMVDMVS